MIEITDEIMAGSDSNVTLPEATRHKESTRVSSNASKKIYDQENNSHQSSKRLRLYPTARVGKTLKQSQLPRPKQPVTFTLPPSLALIQSPLSTPPVVPKTKGNQSRSSTPTPAPSDQGAESQLRRLNSISILLTAIHRRNRNQHRNQRFYRHFLTLRRTIKKLTALYEEYVQLRHSKSTIAADFRQRFEQESLLRSQRDIVQEYIRETLVPTAYVAFSSVVADTQFANLGLVLIGLLVDVIEVVGRMSWNGDRTRVGAEQHGVEGSQTSTKRGRLVGLSTLMTGPDNGTVVERVYDSDGSVRLTGEQRTSNKTRIKDTEDTSFDMGEVIAREDSVNLSKTALGSDGRDSQIETSKTVTRGATQVDSEVTFSNPSPTPSSSSLQADPSGINDESREFIELTSDDQSILEPESAHQTSIDSQDNRHNTPDLTSKSPQSTKPTMTTTKPPSAAPHLVVKPTFQNSGDLLDPIPPAPSISHPRKAGSTARSEATELQVKARKAERDERVADDVRVGKNKSEEKNAKLKKKEKKKKKRTNAIDDLFSGFG